ncbi:hypothetical protein [Actinokineospora sp. HUAS TT18]|uniref:hypothetical protein n=1 Tax=Actinokineospora sp. HUAS TT18 TaxID=3447451 RepID=UPI003F52014F
MKRVCLILAAGLTLAGCGDEPSAPAVNPTVGGLAEALSSIANNDESRTYVEYADLTKVAALRDKDKQKARMLEPVGYSGIGNFRVKIKEELAVDLTAFKEAVTVGMPPTVSARFRGAYDNAALNAKLGERKATESKSGGYTVWRTGEDDKIQLDGPMRDVGPLNQFNAIRTSPTELAHSASGERLAWFDKGSLLDDPAIKSLATCLDDVSAAILQAAVEKRPAVAAGVEIADDTTDVVCLRAKSNEDAGELRKQIEATLKGAKTVSGTPWSKILPNPTVEAVGDTVRITAKSETPGLVFSALNRGDLDMLVNFE